MATSPNFSWPEPDNTDLVKNGALAIRTAVDAIDSSMVDLKGGTTGQVLSKASNTDMDFSWVTDATGIPATIFDAKGDIIAATAADTASRLAVGTNGQVLTADSTAATGIKWATPATGSSGMTLISTQTASDVATLTFDNVFSSSYLNYLLVFNGLRSTSSANTADAYFQWRYAGPTTETTQYKYGLTGINTGGTVVSVGATGASQGILTRNLGDATYKTSGFLFINQVGNVSEMPFATGQTIDAWAEEMLNVSIYTGSSRTFTGFIISTSSGNINGTFTLYGLAKS